MRSRRRLAVLRPARPGRRWECGATCSAQARQLQARGSRWHPSVRPPTSTQPTAGSQVDNSVVPCVPAEIVCCDVVHPYRPRF